jgi:hypothetical protein
MCRYNQDNGNAHGLLLYANMKGRYFKYYAFKLYTDVGLFSNENCVFKAIQPLFADGRLFWCDRADTSGRARGRRIGAVALL